MLIAEALNIARNRARYSINSYACWIEFRLKERFQLMAVGRNIIDQPNPIPIYHLLTVEKVIILSDGRGLDN